MWLLMLVKEHGKEEVVFTIREFRKYITRIPLNETITIKKVLSLEFKRQEVIQ